MARSTNLIFAGVLFLGLGKDAKGDVTITSDFDDWSSAASEFTTLDFTGFSQFTQITTQYQSLGAVFTDGPGPSTDFIVGGPDISAFPLDGWGLNGGLNDEIHISFATPLYSFATHFTGAIQYWLFSDDELLFVSPELGVGAGVFVGLNSTQPFDRVLLSDPTGPVVVVDNIYFASNIPAPAGLALLITSALCSSRRRRG